MRHAAGTCEAAKALWLAAGLQYGIGEQMGIACARERLPISTATAKRASCTEYTRYSLGGLGQD